MKRTTGIRRAFRLPLRASRQVRREVEDEFRFHLDMRAAELARGGLSPDQAHDEARRRFGDLQGARRYCYQQSVVRERGRRSVDWLADLAHDLRLSVRNLRRAPGFAIPAVLTLAIGIGANTLVFVLVNSIMLRPFPYEDPEHLVVVSSTDVELGRSGPLSLPDFYDIRSETETLQDISVWDWEPFNLRGEDETVLVPGGRVTYSLFQVLGVEPLLGRLFTSEDDRQGADAVVILGDGVWRNRFGADPEVIGRTATLDGVSRTVIGVVPDAAAIPEDARIWIPLALGREATSRGQHWVQSVARLKPGVTMTKVRAELDLIGGRLAAEYPGTNVGRSFAVESIRDVLLGTDTRPLMLLMLGSVGFLLLIVCANVANLLLVRGSAREREVGVRVALGATRGRIVRLLLAETGILAVCGGLLGYAIGRLGLRGVLTMIPAALPPWMTFEADRRVLLFVAGAVIASALLAGLAPAFQAARPDINRVLKGASRGASGYRGTGRTRSTLVAAELVLSMVLLVAAGLMIRSFLSVSAVSPGFATDNRMMASMTLPRSKYGEAAAQLRFVDDALETVRGVPDVVSAGIVDRFPMRGSRNTVSIIVQGQNEAVADRGPGVQWNVSSPGYFSASGVPLLRGRTFTRGDDTTGLAVAVINQRMAASLWADSDPLGQRLKLSGESGWTEVVGVVADIRHDGLASEAGPQMYRPFAQSATTRMSLVVHGISDPGLLVESVRAAIQEVDPDVALYDVLRLDEVVSEATWGPRFLAQMFWGFAAIAVFLATIGVYGVVSSAVSQRTRELGIRVVLGARRRNLVRLVVRQTMTIVISALAVGLAIALIMSRLLRSFLYGVESGDAATFGLAAVVLGGAALTAAYMPARRAAQVNPIVALREE